MTPRRTHITLATLAIASLVIGVVALRLLSGVPERSALTPTSRNIRVANGPVASPAATGGASGLAAPFLPWAAWTYRARIRTVAARWNHGAGRESRSLVEPGWRDGSGASRCAAAAKTSRRSRQPGSAARDSLAAATSGRPHEGRRSRAAARAGRRFAPRARTRRGCHPNGARRRECSAAPDPSSRSRRIDAPAVRFRSGSVSCPCRSCARRS